MYHLLMTRERWDTFPSCAQFALSILACELEMILRGLVFDEHLDVWVKPVG